MQENFDLFESVSLFFNKYLTIILLVAGSTVFLSAVYGVVVYQRNSAGQAAYKAFIKLNKLQNSPVAAEDKEVLAKNEQSFTSEVEKWNYIENVASKALQENSSSTFGVHFCLFKIDALLQQGKAEEALDCIKSSLASLPASPIKDFVVVKKALMQLDADDEAGQNEGLQVLKNIANSNSCAADSAYYWLGQYYWIKGNIEEAKILWNSLIALHSKTSDVNAFNDSLESSRSDMFQSPWVEKAKKSLKLIQ